MEYAFTEEQLQVRDSVARFCREQAPASTVRALMESEPGFDAAVWRRICTDLGLVGIHVAEDRGGLGLGPVELGIVMEEFGRSLLPAPYLSSVLALTALTEASGGAGTGPLVDQIIQGERVVTLALDSRHGSPVSDRMSCRASCLHGEAPAVLDGAHADVILVAAPTSGGATLYAVDSDADGLTRHPRRTMDGTRRLARVTLEGCPSRALGVLSEAACKRIYDTALVALANEMVGGAQALFDTTVAYTRMRVQFGRQIGSFQAIKHRLADLLTDVELARVAAYQAAQALTSGENVSATASLAKFVASDAYMTAAREAIQLRGGIGFTWEEDTHLWYRRAKSSEVFLGTPAHHRERMIQESLA